MNKHTILIVDEEDSVKEILKGIFEGVGYKTLTASSGTDALKLVDTESIDIVLMEVWLPDMDGFEVFEEIRKKRRDLPVIIMSGHANNDTAFHAGKIGVYDFLEKPLSLDKILIVAKRAINEVTNQ